MEKIENRGLKKFLSKIGFVFALILIWELVKLIGGYSDLLLPGAKSIITALWIEKDEILGKTLFSLKLISIGLLSAVILAMLATIVSMSGKFSSKLITDIMAIMHPLPGIAVLPVAILWFGTGMEAILFVITFSALWPLLNHFYTGFRSIPINQLEAGKNLGLSGARMGFFVMLPASFPHILGGLRTGWARAWQASVAAELVFGAAGGQGGLGWYLYKKRFMMETSGVFAGMVVIVLIGMAVEHIVFAGIENMTVKKWNTIIQ